MPDADERASVMSDPKSQTLIRQNVKAFRDFAVPSQNRGKVVIV